MIKIEINFPSVCGIDIIISSHPALSTWNYSLLPSHPIANPPTKSPDMRASRLPRRDRKSSSKQETLSLSIFLPILPRDSPHTVIPSPPFRIGSSETVSRYALWDSRRKAAESSLALEGAFNWIRLIRLKSPLLYRKGHLNSTGAIILVPFSWDRPEATRLFSLISSSLPASKRLASRSAYFRVSSTVSFTRSDTGCESTRDCV